MIKSYLPMGYQLQTDEQIKDMDRKFELYDYYGIPYGIFDDARLDINVEKDRTAAKLMIMQGITIPEDLEKRLLEYKDADKRDKRKGVDRYSQ